MNRLLLLCIGIVFLVVFCAADEEDELLGAFECNFEDDERCERCKLRAANILTLKIEVDDLQTEVDLVKTEHDLQRQIDFLECLLLRPGQNQHCAESTEPEEAD